MKQFGLAGILLFWLLAGCGKVGDPHPPSTRTPARVDNLDASQTEDRVTLTWTNPSRNADGTKVDELTEVRILEGNNLIQKLEPTGIGKPQSAPPIDVSAQLNTVRIYTVEVTTRRGKVSAPSNGAMIQIVDFPGVVSGLTGFMDQGRIELSWNPPGRKPALADVYIVRRLDGGIPPQMVSETHFTDESVEAGKTFSYTVTAGHGKTMPVLGPASAPRQVIAKDGKAPKKPTGLKVIESDSGAIIQWDANPESDIAEYRLFRRQDPAGVFVEMNLAIGKSTLIRDPQYKSGFSYTVIAIDLDGNRSFQSDPSN